MMFTSSVARVIQAKRLADHLGIPIEDVMQRHKAGMTYCLDHGWSVGSCVCRLKYTKDGYKKAADAGLCRQCCKSPAVSEIYCLSCKEYRARIVNARKAKNDKAGLCVVCSEPRSPDRTRCPTCLRKNRENKARSTQRSKSTS
jgi:hypothetical protein